MHVSFDDVQICMIVKDEEDILESALAPVANVFRSFVVLDQSSTDRTVEILRQMLGAKVDVITRERDFVTRCGFNAARNLVSEAGSLPWLLHIDADERLRATDGILIEPSDSIGESDIRFAAIRRRNLVGLQADQPMSDDALAKVTSTSDEKHVRLYCRAAGLRWHSFIHEELWETTARVSYDPPLSNLVFDHLSCLKRPLNDAKEELYSWMMLEGLSRDGTEEELSSYARQHALAKWDYHKSRAVKFARMHGLPINEHGTREA